MDCLKRAIKEVLNLQRDEEFLVKDLFKGYEWNRLAIGERRMLGSLFLNEVRNGRLTDIVNVAKKSSANQQIYIKL
ncbi:single-stranded DNA-binding protein [Mesobacillus sp. AQ2]|uniref:single-stranded DNA-binding protein n=1 Tax=Mesobacillus sp. AQ2 TaxID=3043332 RepID=UPI0024C15411|nr:single-stranded DNA-binding protein [Mesobacillus sp. AQ2]WHX41179.1 single-stranded DNA-binding protein [Mesobacillus sp. AQ2]